MPKRLKTQARGKGGPVWVATTRGTAVSRYANFDVDSEEVIKGEVVELLNDSARTSVLARIVLDNGDEEYLIAAEGLKVGQRIEHGKNAGIEIGNVKTLGSCIEGCPVFNIEKYPGDGGSMVRSSGAYALILSKDSKSVFVKMPSGKIIQFDPRVRATIGMAGCGGRTDKPFVKAGNKWIAMKRRHKKYPIVRGIAKNAKDHPFGGGNHHPGKSKSTARGAPPGRKVGDIASRRTGRVKKN